VTARRYIPEDSNLKVNIAGKNIFPYGKPSRGGSNTSPTPRSANAYLRINVLGGVLMLLANKQRVAWTQTPS
jgi:hypothetical protein